MSELKKEQKLIDALGGVIDPELHIPITDLGLIYGAHTDENGVAHITMTLTTIGCPLYDVIHDDIKKAVTEVSGISDVEVELTFDPPWTPEMMSEEMQIELGLL